MRKEIGIWRQFKYQNLNEEENLIPQLGSSNNRFAMLSRIMENTSHCSLDNEDMLREVIVKIGLERLDMQKKSNSRGVVG